MFLILDPAMWNHPAAAFALDSFLRAGFIFVPRSAMAPNRTWEMLDGWTWLRRHACWHPGRVVHENGIF
ncbi:MAG: hypothetical protein ACT6U0_18095 [Shinella sp.]|uniref:hypothetical protein n=1 Tax=Shinella sp. TaxID=1870904 RepID=UPI0040356813